VSDRYPRYRRRREPTASGLRAFNPAFVSIAISIIALAVSLSNSLLSFREFRAARSGILYAELVRQPEDSVPQYDSRQPLLVFKPYTDGIFVQTIVAQFPFFSDDGTPHAIVANFPRLEIGMDHVMQSLVGDHGDRRDNYIRLPLMCEGVFPVVLTIDYVARGERHIEHYAYDFHFRAFVTKAEKFEGFASHPALWRVKFNR
jgi:hypothetical protein